MSNLQRPILRLPTKTKPAAFPHSIEERQALAAHLEDEQTQVLLGSRPTASGVLPPKRGPPVAFSPSKAPSRRERRHTPRAIDLSQPGFLRLEQVLAIFPVSRASWYAGIGKIYPNSVQIGPRSVAWRTEDIRALVANPPAFDRD